MIDYDYWWSEKYTKIKLLEYHFKGPYLSIMDYNSKLTNPKKLKTYLTTPHKLSDCLKALIN